MMQSRYFVLLDKVVGLAAIIDDLNICGAADQRFQASFIHVWCHTL
jgi:hypothetical protein